MRVFVFRSIGAVGVLGLLAGILSCARDQQLVGISIQPTEETFGNAQTPVSFDAGSSVQLRAIGHYIHPPVSKDITNEVTWTSDDVQMVTVNSTGLDVATGNACGSSLISATLNTNVSAGGRSSSGAIVTGFMTTNVVCFTGTGDVLSVQFSGTGSGVVGSTPGGLGCASTSTSCSGTFAPGATVNITATPNIGSTFGQWLGCDSVSGPSNSVCTVVLLGNRTIAVTFN